MTDDRKAEIYVIAYVVIAAIAFAVNLHYIFHLITSK
jgi:hypothetical protein